MIACVTVPELPTRQQEVLCNILEKFSPNLQSPAPGVCWLDPSGLHHFYPDLQVWAEAIFGSLCAQNWRSAVVVGFHRYRTWAIATARPGVTVIKDAAAEQSLAQTVRLDPSTLPAWVYAEMQRLGIETLADFLALSSADIVLRYGEQAGARHIALKHADELPIQPQRPLRPAQVSLAVEPADDDVPRLLFLIKNGVQKLLAELSGRCHALTALQLRLTLDHAPARTERIETAEPTCAVVPIIDLVRLRLLSVELAAPVEQIDLLAESVLVTPRQISYLSARPRRDFEAGKKALAQVNAIFGNGAVTRPQLLSEHLPEHSFVFAPMLELRSPHVPETPRRSLLPLVRSLSAHPVRIASPLYASTRLSRIETSWWQCLTARDYYFVETEAGAILWVFFDRGHQRWFIHGAVN